MTHGRRAHVSASMNTLVVAQDRSRAPGTLGLVPWCGLVVWVAAVVAIGAPLQERILLLGPLVIVPTLLGLLPSRPIGHRLSTRDLGGAPALIAALPLVLGAAALRGPVAGALALPWLVLAVAVAIAGIADGLRSLPSIVSPARASDLATDAAMGALAVGAAWLSADRAGIPLAGFVAPIATLTAVHFHFAGFGLVAVAGLMAAVRPGRLAWMAVLGLIAGIGITAAGFLLPVSPANLIGALMVAGSGLAVASLVASLLWRRRERALVPTWIAVGCLTGGMLMALVWAVSLALSSQVKDIETMILGHTLDLDVMVHVHGSLNAMAVLLFASTARTWTRHPNDQDSNGSYLEPSNRTSSCMFTGVGGSTWPGNLYGFEREHLRDRYPHHPFDEAPTCRD
jgi:hypothetical protein